jgi:hypothetical protein
VGCVQLQGTQALRFGRLWSAVHYVNIWTCLVSCTVRTHLEVSGQLYSTYTFGLGVSDQL